LLRAAAQARQSHPEISRVLLFGSLVRGNWTAASDADLIVVVRRDFRDLFERSRYQIFCPSIPTDTLVYSEAEFEALSREPDGFLPGALEDAMEL
jgi:hypothetical protein